MRNVHATIEELDYRQVQRITIDVTRKDELNCPPVPREASFGDDWICLQSSDQLGDMGYWQIDPEGVAMQLLRAAWIMAHKEQAARQAPFDGDPRPMWEK